MPLDTTFAFGPFRVDAIGRLSVAQENAGFTCRWRDRRVEVDLIADVGAVRIELGRVPSTADDAGRRGRSLSAVSALPGLLPSGWWARLLPDHRVMVGAPLPGILPAHAADMLASVTARLLAMAPYADLMDEEGLETVAG